MIAGSLRPRSILHTAHTIRFRLAALYGGLLFGASSLALGVAYAVLEMMAPSSQNVVNSPTGVGVVSFDFGACDDPVLRHFSDCTRRQTNIKDLAAEMRRHEAARAHSMHVLQMITVLAFVLLIFATFAVAWWATGRALRPIRRIAATARHLSIADLSRRVDLRGPDDELKELADTLDDLLERLDAAFASQEHFITNASRRLRAPLEAQQSAVAAALAQPTEDALLRMAEDVHTATLRQQGLVDGLLTLAHAERGIDQYHTVDLAEIVWNCFDDAISNKALLALGVTHDLNRAELPGDHAMLGRMVMNLVENAIQHNLPGGTLNLITRTEHGHAMLRLSNTGPNIGADTLAALAQPLRQDAGSAEPADNDRVGLGLPIAVAVAHAHRGTLHAEPNPDGGLTVTVMFPVPEVVTA